MVSNSPRVFTHMPAQHTSTLILAHHDNEEHCPCLKDGCPGHLVKISDAKQVGKAVGEDRRV